MMKCLLSILIPPICITCIDKIGEPRGERFTRKNSWTMDMKLFPWIPIDPIHKSQNALVPYPTIHHSEQKCVHFCSEWCIVGYGTGALWDLRNWAIAPDKLLQLWIICRVVSGFASGCPLGVLWYGGPFWQGFSQWEKKLHMWHFLSLAKTLLGHKPGLH